jgi:Pentapeptide repeats (9 copies)
MSPQIEAALIAGSVGVLTLIGTLAAQFYGIRRTSKDTLNARFATAADKLGSEAPAVRLAGVYAMAGLADDWPENRQTCVDVLCAYLRLPYDPDPDEDSDPAERAAYRANREVRHTVIRVITAHLKDDAPVSWQGLNFDFTGVIFDGGDFTGAEFSGGEVSFVGAEFSGGEVSFRGAQFSGGTVNFLSAEFDGGKVFFSRAVFSGGAALFGGAEFSGGEVNFSSAHFSGGTVDFGSAGFSGGQVSFDGAEFSGGEVSFGARFSGGEVSFGGAVFSGSEVDFTNPGDWSVPPAFPWTDTPPTGVKLPKKEDQSQV